MTIWVIRVLVFIGGPLAGWFQISRDKEGIFLGLAIALGVILIEMIIERIPLDTLIFGALGAILGLVSAKLLDYSIFQLENPKLNALMAQYSFLIKGTMACLGLMLAVNKKSELELLDKNIALGSKKNKVELHILDTSAIIDGRIADICETKFLAGTLIVPNFVLKELQNIADSADGNKRARGRRGLDILNRLQESSDLPVKIYDKDYPKIGEVDAKIVKLAEELAAKVITTDFNLNKIASLQGVTVLNINDLSNVLKPIVLPGEAMNVFVVKEGKEREQGIAYLDDGTMVVVEEGRRSVGKRLEVIVSSIIQTSAGRMIFTRLKEDNGHYKG
ncbi:MAG: PIN domain-containing protein [Elusimicrobiota bacterium]